MSNSSTPKFYQPLFGNDNFYAPDVIDIAAFTAPVAQTLPVAQPTETAKAKA